MFSIWLPPVALWDYDYVILHARKIIFREIKWLAQGSSTSKIKLNSSNYRACDFFHYNIFPPNLCNLKILHEARLVELYLLPAQPLEHETD